MNGRVNIIGHNDVDKFLLYETPNIEKSTEYKNALVGNFETSVLSKAFFSADNIDNLQKKLIVGVYKKSNGLYNIGYQDQDVLKFLQGGVYDDEDPKLLKVMKKFLKLLEPQTNFIWILVFIKIFPTEVKTWIQEQAVKNQTAF